MVAILTTYNAVSKAAKRNLDWGLRREVWGLPRLPLGPDDATGFSWHLMGTRARGLPNGPRAQPEIWVTGGIDIFLSRAVSELEEQDYPLWPDEIENGRVIYPYRFKIKLVGSAKNVPLGSTGPLPPKLSEGIRIGATGGPSIVSIRNEELESLINYL